MKENGFAPIRRGLWEHIRDGRMSHLEALAFVYVCSQADTRTGIWKGCAKALAGELGMRERTARDVLEKMEHGDYIRRFATPGLHSCYPILVHKFQVTQGEHNGEQLNALESKSPADLTYFSREQDGEQSVEHGVEHGAAQRRSEKGKGKNEKKHHPKKRDDVVSLPKSFSEKAKKTLSEKYPGDGEEKINFGLQIIEERAYNSASHPRSEAYFIAAYENLRMEERFEEELEWYKESPNSNEQRTMMNAIIRKAEEESKRTGRDFLDCFNELKNTPFEEVLQ
jgi:hypothetical protein